MTGRTLADSTVLVTGGTGSFGRTMVARLLREGVREVRILSRDEQKQDAMRRDIADARIRYTLGSVTDPDTVMRVMRGSDYVFHAAAHKIVPSVEEQPYPAVLTNVIGSHIVSCAAADCGTRAVFLSTDKAVEPINAMGATKMLMERIVGAVRAPQVVTRYGNVIGSRGSVLPVFKAFLEASRAIPVTDPQMTRFLMTLDEAVDLVITAMLGDWEPGTVLVHRAPAATVGEIARAMIRLHGGGTYTVCGVRPGEKTHETLVTAEEMGRAVAEGSVIRVPRGPSKTHGTAFTSANAPRLTREELDTLIVQAGFGKPAYHANHG